MAAGLQPTAGQEFCLLTCDLSAESVVRADSSDGKLKLWKRRAEMKKKEEKNTRPLERTFEIFMTDDRQSV